MRGIVLRTKGFDTPDQEQQAKEMIESLLYAVPWWVRTLTVAYDPRPDDPDQVAGYEGHPSNQEVKIIISPLLYRLSPAEQRATLMHEVAHALRERTTIWIRDRVIPLLKEQNDALADFVMTEYEERMEEEVEGLAQTLLRNEQYGA